MNFIKTKKSYPSLLNKLHRIAFALFAVVLFSVSVNSQSEKSDESDESDNSNNSNSNINDRSNDTLFNKIELSEDGVVAVGLDGKIWHYDFTNETFVEGDESEQSGENRSETGSSDSGEELSIEERCVVKKEIIKFSKRAFVDEDEYVDGDIVVIGLVTIKGWVKGDVKSLSKRVLLKESGRVDGDIIAPDVIIREGSIHNGRVYESSDFLNSQDISFDVDGVILVMVFTAFLLLAGFMLNTLMPTQMKNIENCLNDNRMKSFLFGILSIPLLPLLMVLIIITLVGVLVFWLVPVAYFLAMIIGVVTFGGEIGKKVLSKFMTNSSKTFQSSIGIILFMLLWFVSVLLISANSGVSPEMTIYEGVGKFLLFVSILISIYPLATGLGVVAMTRFGFIECHKGKSDIDIDLDDSEMPAPPPIMDSPDIK